MSYATRARRTPNGCRKRASRSTSVATPVRRTASSRASSCPEANAATSTSSKRSGPPSSSTHGPRPGAPAEPFLAHKGDLEMASSTATRDVDAVVIGSGFAGLYMNYRLRDMMGMDVQVYEAGDGVGGTWYWNRYPGARCDSESYMYCFSFDKQLMQEWEWSGKYPEQPEILRYLNHLADRFDLRRNIKFGTRVTAAHYYEETNRWVVETDRGDTVTAKFVITAIG